MLHANFMDKGHQFRFSACLAMMNHVGAANVRIAPAARGAETFVGVDVSGFVTALRLDEVDNIKSVADRVDSLPKTAVQFVDDLKTCADHIREDQERKKARMI